MVEFVVDIIIECVVGWFVVVGGDFNELLL